MCIRDRSDALQLLSSLGRHRDGVSRKEQPKNRTATVLASSHSRSAPAMDFAGPAADSTTGAERRRGPVSYTHLDVYKRQVL